MDQLLASFETLQDAVAGVLFYFFILRRMGKGGASKTENVEAILQQFIDNFAGRQPAPRDSREARERHVQKSQFTEKIWRPEIIGCSAGAYPPTLATRQRISSRL